ncbi:membrane protein [Cytophagales bacterium WSM2-2]|nr:membrane protein [Cytophagales bacterium WSM2-2]
MKSVLLFTYSIISYLIGFVSLLFWILSVSNLIPEISIDRNADVNFPLALTRNLGLVLLFAVPHSVMARKWFKDWITKFIPTPIERSTYVWVAGVLLAVLTWYWAPLGGMAWNIPAGTTLFYVVYVLFFLGWAILFTSTFLINHFDLFGLRQTYLELTGKPYTPLKFKIVAYYKYARHPLYLGGILGLWAAPVMTMTHLFFAVLLTVYFIIGAIFEEEDMMKEFGHEYKAYKNKTPMFLPFLKRRTQK